MCSTRCTIIIRHWRTFASTILLYVPSGLRLFTTTFTSMHLHTRFTPSISGRNDSTVVYTTSPLPLPLAAGVSCPFSAILSQIVSLPACLFSFR